MKHIACIRVAETLILAGVMTVAAFAGASATESAAAACAEKLEQTRLWIRAADPLAPAEEQARLSAAIAESRMVCVAAQQAAPDDGGVLVNAAYAHFASDDRPAGIRLIEQAAASGYPPAMVMMARYLVAGDTVEKDAERAWMLLLQVLASDHPSARMQAALEFLPGGAGPENPKRVKQVLREMINAGNGEAQIAYAMKVLDLQNAKKGSAEAVEGLALLERAARESKDGTAMIYLSLLYNQGVVVDRDAERAIQYAQMAIDAGYRRGYGTMGQIYQNQGDPDVAAAWFRRGAAAGDGFAQGMLGYMYSSGFGVEQDMEQALVWWTRGRWNGDRLSAGYLQVHREQEAERQAWEAAKSERKEPAKTE